MVLERESRGRASGPGPRPEGKQEEQEMAAPQHPPAHSLGQIVLEKGWATIEQINEARRFQARKKVNGEKVTIAEAMVALGILTEVQVRRALGGRLAPPP